MHKASQRLFINSINLITHIFGNFSLEMPMSIRAWLVRGQLGLGCLNLEGFVLYVRGGKGSPFDERPHSSSPRMHWKV